MNITRVSENVFQIRVNIEDSGYLFEGLWSVPNGVSINSYLVKGAKTAIIDLTQDINELTQSFELQVVQSGTSLNDLDFVIINHMEPDHSGLLRDLAQRNQNCRFICSEKAAPLLQQFSSVPGDRVDIVSDGDSLDLGDGVVLQFYLIPNVHWPETMATYLASERILFSCDAFGSYGAVKDQAFDDQLSKERAAFFEQETLRYYANIVATFSPFVEKAIEKLADLKIDVIAPSHGIVWRKDPAAIIKHYKRYASYAKGPAEPEVCLVWASMYGNTGKSVTALVKGIKSEGVDVAIFRVPQDDTGHILAAAWKSAGLAFAMPTYEYKMFPPMAQVIEDLMVKKIKNRKVLRIGSYGWVGGAEKDFRTKTEKAGWDIMESIEFQGSPGESDLAAIEKAGKQLAKDIRKFSAGQV